MAFTITVNHDDNHTLIFSKNILARRNEANVSVTVVVPAAVFALGSFAYIDFVLPDGSTYFKGAYDPSSGSFTFTLGSADTILSQDGRIGIQFVLRDSDVLPTVVWKSELKYALVGGSADATAHALTGIPSPATFPAANTSLVDAGTYFASPDVEDALQEVGADLTAIITSGVATPFTNMPYVGTAPIIESGSNANGSYIKFADGTMICTALQVVSGLANTSVNGALYSGSGAHTFSAEFYAAPTVSIMYIGEHYIFTNGYNRTTTQVIYFTSSTISETVTDGYISIIAIGRWKA